VFERVRLEDISMTLEPLFAFFAGTRRKGESFGDFCHRQEPAVLAGIAAPAARAAVA
jgi:sulfite reductase beta subunit-like hemoprotein